jgi:hypothetical protein
LFSIALKHALGLLRRHASVLLAWVYARLGLIVPLMRSSIDALELECHALDPIFIIPLSSHFLCNFHIKTAIFFQQPTKHYDIKTNQNIKK